MLSPLQAVDLGPERVLSERVEESVGAVTSVPLSSWSASFRVRTGRGVGGCCHARLGFAIEAEPLSERVEESVGAVTDLGMLSGFYDPLEADRRSAGGLSSRAPTAEPG